MGLSERFQAQQDNEIMRGHRTRVWVSILSVYVCKCVLRWFIWQSNATLCLFSSSIFQSDLIEKVLTLNTVIMHVFHFVQIIYKGIQFFHDKLLHAAQSHWPTERPLASYLPYLWWFLSKHTWGRKVLLHSPLSLCKQQEAPWWINCNLVQPVSQSAALEPAGDTRWCLSCWQKEIWLSDRDELVRQLYKLGSGRWLR